MDYFSLLYSLQYFLVQIFLFLNFLKNKNKTQNKNKEGISVLIPSYDEVLTIKDCLNSVINAKREFDIEIIVIDDGKQSDTLDCLKEEFEFVRKEACRRFINETSVREVYYHKGEIDIYVIDKDNEGKSKALNAGLKLSHYNYFLTLDADSLLDEMALINVCYLLTNGVIAVGGNIEPLEYNKSFLGRIITNYQKWEYFWDFSYSRIVLNNIGCVPILSGALSLFDKQAVININGYRDDTLAEDFDITLRLREYAIDNNKRILYSSSFIAYTQVPFDFKSLFSQRLRWYLGFLEVIKKHISKIRKDKQMSSILLFIFIYGYFSCVLEAILIFLLKKYYLLMATLQTMLTLVLLFVIKIIKRDEIKIHYILLIFLQLFFHLINTVVHIKSIIKFLFNNNKASWGTIKRRTLF